MAEYVIDTEYDTLRVQAGYWVLDAYSWFNFCDDRQGEEQIILTVKSSIVRSIRRFEEPTEA